MNFLPPLIRVCGVCMCKRERERRKNHAFHLPFPSSAVEVQGRVRRSLARSLSCVKKGERRKSILLSLPPLTQRERKKNYLQPSKYARECVRESERVPSETTCLAGTRGREKERGGNFSTPVKAGGGRIQGQKEERKKGKGGKMRRDKGEN